MCKAGAQQDHTVPLYEETWVFGGTGMYPIGASGRVVHGREVWKGQTQGARPSLAAGSGRSAVAVGRGGVLHALCAAVWL